MSSQTNFMLEPDAVKLLERHAIDYPKNSFVTAKEGIAVATQTIGFPLVMKIVSPDIIHKSDAGGVVTNVTSLAEAEAAYDRITESVQSHDPNADIRGLLLCEQAEKGQEIIIGTVIDDVFGHAIMFGLGGIFVEVLEDVTFRICPVDKKEALQMIREIRGYEILKGTRGKPELDIEGLAELISKVSELVTQNDNIKEVDLNPVRVYEDKVSVLDARVILRPQTCA